MLTKDVSTRPGAAHDRAYYPLIICTTMPTVDYIIEGKYFGSSPVPHVAQSVALYCEICGDLWARCVSSVGTRTILTQRCCSRHTPLSVAGGWGEVPGTISSWRSAAHSPSWDTANCVEYLPRQVLLREFTLLAEYLTRQEYQHEQESHDPNAALEDLRA